MQKIFDFDIHIGDWRILIQGRDIKNGAVQGRHIADGTITSKNLNENLILDNSKIADKGINGNNIADGAVTNKKLADNSIESPNIAPGAVTREKISDNAVEELTGFYRELQEENNQKFAQQDDVIEDGLSQRYTKEETNNIISRTPETDVVVLDIPEGSTAADVLDTIPVADRANKLFRVRNEANTHFDEYGWTGEVWALLASKDYGIDDEPDPESDNLFSSKGAANSYGHYVENPEWTRVLTDKDGKVLGGIKVDGTLVCNLNMPESFKEEIQRQLSSTTINNCGVVIFSPIFNINGIQKITKMPTSGIYVYRTGSATFKPTFYKKEGISFIVDTEYEYSSHSSYWHRATYFPYKEGLYYSLMLNGGTAEDIHVTYGTITEAGGRLPNLFSLGVYQKYANGERRVIFSPYTEFLQTQYLSYGSILRVQDVRKIIAAPSYSLICSIYKKDSIEKKFVWVENRYAGTDPSGETPGIAGISEIDVSDYDYDGYIIVAIKKAVAESSDRYFTSKPMGMMNLFEDTQKSVFVQWRSNVNVSYDNNIPAVIRSNIETISKGIFAPDMKGLSDSAYGCAVWPEGASYNPQNIPDMGEVRGWWYNGDNDYNNPHMHVRPKSFITASRNRHSRVYNAWSVGHTSLANMYGSECASTAAMLLGQPSGLAVPEVINRHRKGLSYREFTGYEDLNSGDFYAENTDDNPGGHILFVAEKVFINGELYCINSFEGYPPCIGWNTYVNHEAERNFTVENPYGSFNPINFKTSLHHYFEVTEDKYIVVARPISSLCQNIRDSYSLNGEYDYYDERAIDEYQTTEIMCDRGTDAIYCIGEYVGVTVTDGTTELVIYKDGVQEETLDLTQYPVVYPNEQTPAGESSDIVYDLTDYFNENDNSGHYFELYANGVKKESFYIGPNRDIVLEESEEECLIKFDTDEFYLDEDQNKIYTDKSIVIRVQYKRGDSSIKNIRYFWEDLENVIEIDGIAVFAVPKTTSWYDGVERDFYGAMVVRRTEYGVYRSYRNINGRTIKCAGFNTY